MLRDTSATREVVQLPPLYCRLYIRPDPCPVLTCVTPNRVATLLGGQENEGLYVDVVAAVVELCTEEEVLVEDVMDGTADPKVAVVSCVETNDVLLD